MYVHCTHLASSINHKPMLCGPGSLYRVRVFMLSSSSYSMIELSMIEHLLLLSVEIEEVGHDHVRTKSGRVAPYITLYKM